MKNIALILFTILLVSCGNKEQKETNENKTVFRYNESAGITILDPAYVRRFEDFLAIEQLYNRLVTLDEKLRITPSIAESYEISEDGLEYTFHLRKDVFFHDHNLFDKGKGRVVTANDVIYSFLRIIDPLTASPGKYIFQNIDRSEKSKYRGMIAEDDYTLKIFLKKPQPSFIYQLSLPYCSIVAHEIVDHYGNDYSQHPIGTGPFQFKSWKPEIKLVMTKNTSYFEFDEEGNRLPYLDAVAVYFIKDKHQEYIKFKSGDLEMISGLNDEDKDELLNVDGELHDDLQDQFYLQKMPWLNTDYLGILVDENINNNSNNPLAEKLVRQAIGYAIDRDEFVKHLRNNVGIPATEGFIPFGMPGFEKYAIKGFNYDPSRAKLLLNEAGFPNGKGAPEITLTATEEYRTMCEWLQNSIEEIGLDVKVDINSVSSMNQKIALFDANFYRKSWIADYPEAINYFQLFYSKNFYPENGSNYTHFKNEEYDKIYEQAIVEKDDDKRYEMYHAMNEIIHDHAPVIPLFYAETLRFLKNTVSGLEGNSLNMLSLKKVQVEK